jgi:glutathionyl-hydroquinone reductase
MAGPFQPGPGVVPDTVSGTRWLHQLYTLGEPHRTSRVTVPVLWNKVTRKIVSNESADIIRMFNTAFDRVGVAESDYYPTVPRGEIDAINARVCLLR